MTTKKGYRAQEILQALARMLEMSKGGRITTAALASELGVSEAALYRHFPSKTRMFEGLIDFIEDTIFGRITSIVQEESGAEDICFRILTLLLAFAEKNPGITRILNGDALTGETQQLHQRVAQFYDRLESQLKQVLRESKVRDGTVMALPISVAVNLMLCAVEGKIHQYVRSEFKSLPSSNWQEQWELMAVGLFSK